MNTATDLASVLRRSAELEEDLVAFGEGRSFERFLDPLLTEAAGPEGALDEATAINVIDRFLLQYRLPDGTTVADRFAIRRTDLTDTDRQMVLAWRDPVEALFEVRGKDRDCLLPAQPAGRPGVPDLHQRRAGGFPRGHARRLPRRRLVALTPVPGTWLVSGAESSYPRAAAPEVACCADANRGTTRASRARRLRDR